MVEKAASLKFKPNVMLVVQQFILWYSEPLQAIAERHHSAYTVGMQVGDVLMASMNLSLYIQTNYLSGQNLSTVHSNMKDYIQNHLTRNQQDLIDLITPLYYHVIALQQGLHMLDAGRVDDIPTEAEMKNTNTQGWFNSRIHHLTRTFLFRQLGDEDVINISDVIKEKKVMLRPTFAFGIFYEGLACFLSSFRANDLASKAILIERGRSILARIKGWLQHSSWNWENKVLLLEAMDKHTSGNYDAAEPLYSRSIRSAHQHKFIHEVAISSELLGDFFYERGDNEESYTLYMHSIKCFSEWGALALAKRVESSVRSKFGDENIIHLGEIINVDDMMQRILDKSTSSDAKKRQVMD